MALGLLPLLALFGGAIVIAGGKKKKSSATAPKRSCSPADVFGVSYAPMDEPIQEWDAPSQVPMGGYPIYAKDFVAQWVKDNPDSFTARYFKSRAGWTKSFVKAYITELDKADEFINQGAPWGNYEFTHARAAVDKMEDDFTKRKAGAQSSVWKAAQEICAAIGCRVQKSGDNRISTIISDNKQWTLWLMALGVYMNLPENKAVIHARKNPSSEWPADAYDYSYGVIGSYKRMIGDFLGREIAGARSSLSENPNKIESEMAQYGSIIGPMMEPSAEVLAYLEANDDKSGWRFNDVRATNMPFNEIEERGLAVLSDIWKFFTGRSGIVINENKDIANSVLYAWLSIDITGKAPETLAGTLLMIELSPGTNRSTVFPAFSELQNSGYIRSIASEYGMKPLSSVRTSYGDRDWWTMGNGGEAQAGYCISQSPIRKERFEELAVAILSNEMACDQDPDGGYDYGGSPLVDLYPTYVTFFDKNPMASYDVYLEAVDNFKAQYPIAHYAISNLMTLLVNEFDPSMWDDSNAGFGG